MRVDWLQEGDKNVAFFHNSLKTRWKGGYISSIVTSEGVYLSSSREMSHEATYFYSTLFSKDSSPTSDEENLILNCIPSLVSREMNANLLKPISMSELEKVVFGMNKGKASGPDGFPIEFF